jgi:hypothetical protein
MCTTDVQVHPNNAFRLQLVPGTMVTVPSLTQHVVLPTLTLRFWNIVCPIHQGWNFSTPLNSVPPFVVATAVDQPEVQAILLHLRYPLWFRNRMTMGCVMNLYGINRDDNAGNTPTPMCPFELFPQ